MAAGLCGVLSLSRQLHVESCKLHTGKHFAVMASEGNPSYLYAHRAVCAACERTWFRRLSARKASMLHR